MNFAAELREHVRTAKAAKGVKFAKDECIRASEHQSKDFWSAVPNFVSKNSAKILLSRYSQQMGRLTVVWG